MRHSGKMNSYGFVPPLATEYESAYVTGEGQTPICAGILIEKFVPSFRFNPLQLDVEQQMTVIIHHVLPKYQSSGLQTNFDPAQYIPAILAYIERWKPLTVIVTQEDSNDELYEELRTKATFTAIWRWHHFFDSVRDNEIADQLGVYQSDLVETYVNNTRFMSVIQPWMKNLEKENVIVLGGFRTECVEGLTDGLCQLEVDYHCHSDLMYPR